MQSAPPLCIHLWEASGRQELDMRAAGLSWCQKHLQVNGADIFAMQSLHSAPDRSGYWFYLQQQCTAWRLLIFLFWDYDNISVWVLERNRRASVLVSSGVCHVSCVVKQRFCRSCNSPFTFISQNMEPHSDFIMAAVILIAIGTSLWYPYESSHIQIFV